MSIKCQDVKKLKSWIFKQSIHRVALWSSGRRWAAAGGKLWAISRLQRSWSCWGPWRGWSRAGRCRRCSALRRLERWTEKQMKLLDYRAGLSEYKTRQSNAHLNSALLLRSSQRKHLALLGKTEAKEEQSIELLLRHFKLQTDFLIVTSHDQFVTLITSIQAFIMQA